MSGWVGNGGEGQDDPYPVETMAWKLKQRLQDTEPVCMGYNGQNRKCCDNVRMCFVELRSALDGVQLAAVGNQNMHVACRTVERKLGESRQCMTSWASQCHASVNADVILRPFDDALLDMNDQQAEFCSNLPPEPTTRLNTSPIVTTRSPVPETTPSKPPTPKSSAVPPTSKPTSVSTTSPNISETTSTSPPTSKPTLTTVSTSTLPKTSVSTPRRNSATTLKPTSTMKTSTAVKPNTNVTSATSGQTVKPIETTTKTEQQTNPPFISTSASMTTTTASGQSTSGTSGSPVTQARHGEKDSQDGIIAGSSVVGVVIIALLIIAGVCLWRRRKRRKAEAGSSTDSRKIMWRLFSRNRKSGNGGSDNNDTEIYAEIDDTFRVPSNRSQINVCYESTFGDNDVIIPSSHLKPKSQVSVVTVGNSAPVLDFIRKEDDMVTSFQTERLPNKQVEA
ncbi:hypothetical protein MAR_011193, partial [Mya arenaria]